MTETIPSPAAPRRPRWLIPVIAAAVAALLLLAVAGAGAWWLLAGRTIDVAGDVTVSDLGGVRSIGATCETSGGYRDIARGAQVVIKDSAGAVVATTVLDSGTNTAAGGGSCTFGFRVAVPRGSDFYGVEIGRRGVVQFTADQMGKGVHLTLGS